MNKVFLVFAKMKSLEKDAVLQDCIFIRDKFSLIAFFFTFFWLLYHKLWNWVVLYLSVVIIATSLNVAHYIDDDFRALLLLFISLYVAVFASSILQRKLLKKDYSLKSIILADDHEAALSKFLTLI